MRSLVAKALQVILHTFSRGKSILLLNCPLDVQYNNSECWPAKFFLLIVRMFLQFYYTTLIMLSKIANFQVPNDIDLLFALSCIFRVSILPFCISNYESFLTEWNIFFGLTRLSSLFSKIFS